MAYLLDANVFITGIDPFPYLQYLESKSPLYKGEALARGRQQRLISPRSLFCFWAVREMGNSLASLAIRLRMSPAGIGYAAQRGEAIAQENGYQIIQ